MKIYTKVGRVFFNDLILKYNKETKWEQSKFHFEILKIE